MGRSPSRSELCSFLLGGEIEPGVFSAGSSEPTRGPPQQQVRPTPNQALALIRCRRSSSNELQPRSGGPGADRRDV